MRFVTRGAWIAVWVAAPIWIGGCYASASPSESRDEASPLASTAVGQPNAQSNPPPQATTATTQPVAPPDAVEPPDSSGANAVSSTKVATASSKPDPDSMPEPMPMSIPKPGWLDGVWLDGSANHNCAIKNDHSLWCWGDDFSGQAGVAVAEADSCPVGDADVACVRLPREVAGADWASVSAGEQHTCAIKLDGSLWCWGINRSGELGIGMAGEPIADPVRVGTANDWAAVAAGEEHTCALTTGGLLWCWGRNVEHELGVADAGTQCPYGSCSPSRIQVGTDSDWHFIDAAGQTTFAIRGNGALYCWGSSCEAQMECSTSDCIGQLIRVGEDDDWITANTWASHSCAIKRDGSLWCWGNYGDGPWHATPERIDLGSPVAHVAAGERHTCAVTTDGKLFCVGMDEVGQVGVDPASLSSTCEEDLPCQPSMTQVDAQGDYAAVVAGYDHSCALKKSDGSVWCWGSDLAGQLGRVSSETCFNGAFDQSCGVRPIPIAPIE